jgi:ribonuclease G
VIVRTAGEDRPIADLRREIAQLYETWKKLRVRAGGLSAPALVHREMTLAMRSVRDFSSQDIARIWIEGAETYRDARHYLEQIDPPLTERIRHHKGQELLFDRFGIDRALSRAMRTRVWLRSGGFIVINPTEALVAIDVNSGRNTEGVELEETARITNLEAAWEVARQIRLRDLSGIIVVDFIDMMEMKHRQDLMEAFEAALERDRTRTQVSQMSDFGLVAVTRKRMRGGLLQRMTEPCPCCAGEGWIKDPTTVGLELGRELGRRHSDLSGVRLIVELHPRVKDVLEREQEGILGALREQAAGELELVENSGLQFGEFVIRTE